MAGDKVWYDEAWRDLSGGAGSDAPPFPTILLSDGVLTASSSRLGTQVTATASGTPHTAGSWVEVDPSLSADADGLRVVLMAATNLAGTDTSTLLEIGLGAAASEVVWATIGVGYYITSANVSSQGFRVPGHIPAGSRVAVRARSAVASQAVNAVYSFFSESSPGLAAPVTMGADTATSHGTTLTVAGAINTKSAWTEIEDSTSAEFVALLVSAQCNANTAMGSSGVLVDIGIGAAASETVLIPDIYYHTATSEFMQDRSPTTYAVNIPVGSRLSARYAAANIADRIDLILVGAPSA